MKKKISFAVGMIATISILAFGIYYSSASQVNTTMTSEEISKMVTAQYPGKITKIEKETQSNQPVYAVDLINEEKGYDVKIDANNGEVLEIREKSKEELKDVAMDSEGNDTELDSEENKKEKVKEQIEIKEKDTQKDTKDQKSTKDSNKQDHSDHKEHHMKNHKDHKNQKDHKKHHSDSNDKNKSKKHQAVISEKEAIEIALKEFPGEVDDVDLEKEDGRLIYEIEIERGDQEAEITIDAYTGQIIVIEIDED